MNQSSERSLLLTKIVCSGLVVKVRILFVLFGVLVVSVPTFALQGWMWFNHFPWVYSHEDENWVYITPEIDFSVYDTGQWKKQNDSFVSELSWVWVNHYPYGYSNKEQNWLYISARNQ